MNKQRWDAGAVQRRMLERDWTLADLAEAAALHGYLERDADCRGAIADYDALRDALAVSAEDAEANEDAEACTAEPQGGWRRFDERLLTHARSLERPRGRRFRWPLQLAAAVALASSAGMAGYFFGGSGDSAPVLAERPHEQDAAHLAYLPDDVQQQVDVFGEVSAVFDQQAGWIAFANGRSEMGMARGAVADTPRLLLLRLSLARAGKMISQTDVVIVPGQRASLELPLEDGRTLRYHLHVSDQHPARLGLWAELARPGGQSETLAALATHLELQSGQIVPAGSMVTESGGYELTLGFREAQRPAKARGL